MQVISVNKIFSADKASLVGKAIKYDGWERDDFNHFNKFLTWLDENFEYELKAVGQSLRFHITQRLNSFTVFPNSQPPRKHMEN